MADGSVTPYGRRWEWWHSLWIGWAMLSLGLFGWVSFLYVGWRARVRSWLVWAAVYAVPWIPLLISGGEDPIGWQLFDYSMVLLLVVWLVSSVHAFRIREKYLRRLAQSRIDRHGAPAPQAGRSALTDPDSVNPPPAGWYPDPAGRGGQRWWTGTVWTERAPATESAVYSQSATPARSSTTAPSPVKPHGQDHVLPRLDLNTAREEEIASLPGIGTILAKRVVAERHQRGGFSSVEEMAVAVGLKPHVLQRVRGNLTVGQRPEIRPERPRGRVVDF